MVYKSKHEGFKNPLKINQTDNQKVYFTSDTHFNHGAPWIVEERGFNSIKEHDDFIVNRINEHVKENDILFHVGDFCVDSIKEEAIELLNRISCKTIYFIWGNHDNAIRSLYSDVIQQNYSITSNLEIYPITLINKFHILGHYKEVEVDDKQIVLAHYPLHIWNQTVHGSWCLNGHSHHTCPVTQKNHKECKTLDVGWDGHTKPLSISDLENIMKNKKHVLRDKSH